MAIVRIVRPPGGTEAYDEIAALIGAREDPPAGLILHTAGMVDGSMQIMDVWETAEDADVFDRERVGPAVTQVMGPMGGPPPGLKIYELHEIVQP
jgi:hypothetical protein